MARLDGDLPGDARFVGVGRADNDNARHRAQAGELFDRLVRRPVLAQRQAVVREYMDDVQTGERGEADRRSHVIRKRQEGGAVGNKASVCGKTVDDAAHSVFAHAEMQVAAGVAARVVRVTTVIRGLCRRSRGIKIAELLQVGVRRWVEVGRATEERRQCLGEGVHHLAAGDAGGHPFFVSGENGQLGIPGFRQFAAQPTVELGSEFGEVGGVGGEALFPVVFGDLPEFLCFTEMGQRLIRHQKLFVRRPAELGFGAPHIVFPERRSVRVERVLYRRSEAQMRGDEDERRPRRVSARAGERGVDLGQVVAVGDVDRLPATRLETFGDVFGKSDVGAGRQRDAVVVVKADQLAELEMPGE